MEQQEEILSNKEHITTNTEQLDALQDAVKKEQALHVAEKEQEQIKAIKEEIAQIPPVQEESKTKKGFSVEVPKAVRKTLLTGLFGLSSFFASAKNEKGISPNEDAKNTKKEASIKIAKEMSAVKGLHFYKGGTEKTPTGQDNSFENNPYHVTMEDVYAVAEKYGFNTEDNLSLQKDMYPYLEQHRPDILKQMHEVYGQTNAETFNDGILGSRTAFVINQLNTISQLTPETKTDTTKKEIVGDVYSNFGGRKVPVYDANKHIIAELWYQTTESHNKHNAGILHTTPAILRLRGDFGYTDKVVVLPDGDLQKYFGVTNMLQSENSKQELLKRAITTEEFTQQVSSDIANTVVKN